MEDQVNFPLITGQLKENICEGAIKQPDLPISKICIGKHKDGHYSLTLGVNQKFNWFQKKMIKWCFGFDVKENKYENV